MGNAVEPRSPLVVRADDVPGRVLAVGRASIMSRARE